VVNLCLAHYYIDAYLYSNSQDRNSPHMVCICVVCASVSYECVSDVSSCMHLCDELQCVAVCCSVLQCVAVSVSDVSSCMHLCDEFSVSDTFIQTQTHKTHMFYASVWCVHLYPMHLCLRHLYRQRRTRHISSK